MTFDRDLKEAREQMKRREDAEPYYREAYDAGLEFMMTPQVDLAAERARDRITPSQPSREGSSGAWKYPPRNPRKYDITFPFWAFAPSVLIWIAFFCWVLS